MDLSQSTEDKINKINKEAGVIVMAYLCDIKQYCDDEKVFNEVKNYYVKVYNMDEEMINKEVDNYMNSLYKNPRDSRFYLYMTKDKNTDGEFSRTCNIMGEYGNKIKATYATPNYMDEHFKVIIESDAVQKLSEI